MFLQMRKLIPFIVVALTFGAGVLSAKDIRLETSINLLQKRYSRIRDIHMNFVQSYAAPGRPPKAESGRVYLRRPGLMRWEYQEPRQKLFISNGKTIHFYLPEERQVQKSRVKNTRDSRIPFQFLLGRRNLKKDFSKIVWATEKPFFTGNDVIIAYPKKNIDEFTEILMEYDPRDMQLQRLAIIEQGGARSEFVFTDIQENSGLSIHLFEFQVPPHVEVVGAH